MRAILNSKLKAFKKLLPKRKPSSQKGNFGRLFILSGSRRMVGCAILASQAALRCGAGLLTLGFPKSLHSTYTRRLTEAMFLSLPETKAGTIALSAKRQILNFSKTQDVLALGPGLSREKETQRLIRELVLKTSTPLVIDADGLFPFSGDAGALRKIRKPFIVTPHGGEFQRLFGMNPGRNCLERKEAARKAARACGGVIVLKGHQTVVAHGPKKMYVNPTGNPGLAKGGTGDVLLGMIASFLAQGLEAFDAACLGVFIHGLAADLAVRKISPASLLASDLVDSISSAIQKLS